MTVVLDSSAVMALLQDEPGADSVEETLPGALLSAVNFAEIVSKLNDRGIDGTVVERTILGLGVEVVDFSALQARIAGEFRSLTRTAGLSLGGRACLALASSQNAGVLTTDAAWVGIAAAVNVKISVIRHPRTHG